MSERLALLRAIEAAPDDDNPRMAYCDWLQEHAECGRDEAAAEFLKLSCHGRADKNRLGRAEGKWLDLNWRRLVPALSRRIKGRWKRSGRWVALRAEMPVAVRRPDDAALFELASPRGGSSDLVWTCPVRLEFWRGFVRRALFEVGQELELVLPDLAADQPLCCPDVNFYAPHPTLPDATLLRYADLGEAWWWLPEKCRGIRLNDQEVVFPNDPLGLKLSRERRAAFRGYARHLAQKAGAL